MPQIFARDQSVPEKIVAQKNSWPVCIYNYIHILPHLFFKKSNSTIAIYGTQPILSYPIFTRWWSSINESSWALGGVHKQLQQVPVSSQTQMAVQHYLQTKQNPIDKYSTVGPLSSSFYFKPLKHMFDVVTPIMNSQNHRNFPSLCNKI